MNKYKWNKTENGIYRLRKERKGKPAIIVDPDHPRPEDVWIIDPSSKWCGLLSNPDKPWPYENPDRDDLWQI